ncbi:hypothetical protein ACA910_022059 [Epithemia clementina (nom. ined.)]
MVLSDDDDLSDLVAVATSSPSSVSLLLRTMSQGGVVGEGGGSGQAVLTSGIPAPSILAAAKAEAEKLARRNQSTYSIAVIDGDAETSTCLAFCKGGTFCLNKFGCKLHSISSASTARMSIKDQGIAVVLKTKKAAFVDPTVDQSKLDVSWLEDWKNMTATKEEWLDKFVSGVCLFSKKLMDEEDLLFSVDQGKNSAVDEEGEFLSK